MLWKQLFNQTICIMVGEPSLIWIVGDSVVNNPPAKQETWFDPWVGKIPWRRKWWPTPVFLLGEPQWTEESSRLQSMGSQSVRISLVTKQQKIVMFPGGLVVKNLPANAGDIRDVGSIPGWGRSPGGGHGNPPQYSCLKNPVDGGDWQATVHRYQRVGHTWSNLACMQVLLGKKWFTLCTIDLPL